MIQVRDFSNGADVLAHAAEVRRKFFPARPMPQAHVPVAHEMGHSNDVQAGTASKPIWFPDPNAPRLPSVRSRVEAIKKHYADQYGVTVATLEGEKRLPNIVRARWDVFVALHRAFPHWSSIRVGAALRKGHASVFNAFSQLGIEFKRQPLAREVHTYDRRRTDPVKRDAYNAWRRARRAELRAAGNGMGGY